MPEPGQSSSLKGSSVEAPLRAPPVSGFDATPLSLPAPLISKRALSVQCHLHSMHLDVSFSLLHGSKLPLDGVMRRVQFRTLLPIIF